MPGLVPLLIDHKPVRNKLIGGDYFVYLCSSSLEIPYLFLEKILSTDNKRKKDIYIVASSVTTNNNKRLLSNCF